MLPALLCVGESGRMRASAPTRRGRGAVLFVLLCVGQSSGQAGGRLPPLREEDRVRYRTM